MAGRVAARLLGIGKWLVIVAAALAAALAAINAFDEDLQPEVAAFLEPKPIAVPEKRNGFFQMVGLSAPADDDAHAAGVRYLEEVGRAEARRIGGDREVHWPQHPGKPLSLPKLCGMEGASCLVQVAADEGAARDVVAAHRALLARYRALLAYPEYVETQQLLHPETPLVPFVPLSAAQRVFFVDAALALRAGRAEGLAADLERSLALSRRMLAGSRTVIGKMIAAAHARRAVQFTSELLASPSAWARRHAGWLAEALAPLSPAELRLGEVLGMEFRMQLSVLRECGAELAPRALCYFLQPNATANMDYHRYYQPFTELDAAPPEKLDAMRRALKARDLSDPPWWLAYNPVGKLLSANAHPDWSDYVVRTHDVDALMRLVALQAAIVASGTAAERIPELAAVRERRYADPYTAQPMQWDASRRQLYFEPRSPGVLKGGGVPGRYAVTF